MENIEKAIRKFHDKVVEADRVISELDGLLAMNPESALHSAVWALVGAYKDALGAAYNIDGWLEWWWLECSLGKNPLQASPAGGELRVIATIDDLVRLVCDDLKSSAERKS